MDKVVVITGGTRGIGFSLAETCLANGYRVALCGRTDSSAQKAVSELSQYSDQVKGYGVDVSSYDEVSEFIAAVMKDFGQIDIAVNNAGITKDNLLLRMKPDDFQTVLDTNINSVFNVSKAVLRPMLKQKYGRIINISSVVGCMGNPGQANYAASKAAVMGFTKSLAKEVGSKGITVNVVAPGFIETDMIDALPNEYLDNIIDQIPLKRLGHVEDVSHLVLFLASDHASYITGQVIQVDGGILM